MKTSRKIFLTFISCSIMVLGITFHAFGGQTSININSNSKNLFVPGPVQEEISIEPDTQAMPKLSVGDPRETVFFYYIEVYPEVRRLSDNTTGSLPNNVIAYRTNLTGGYGPYFIGSLSVNDTQTVYKQIKDWGFELLGWHTSVKFRFDFSKPQYFVYELNNSGEVRSDMPAGVNPYQNYIMNFSTPVPSNIDAGYSSSFRGKVYYWHNNTPNWTSDFYSSFDFNSSK